MSILQRLFGKRRAPPELTGASTQAVLIYLDGQGLPDHVYRDNDLSTLEDRLIQAIQAGALGEFDGNEVGPAETTLYMYGPDAERLFAGIESTLRGYPLSKNARVVLRYGGPGANQRELRL
jgi:hypothetical protein